MNASTASTSAEIFFTPVANKNSWINVTNGSFGIGTTVPGQKLDVAGNASAQTFCDGAACTYYADFASTSNSILTAGNVGIGTTAPAYKLGLVDNSGIGIGAVRTISRDTGTSGAIHIGTGGDSFTGNISFDTNGTVRAVIDAAGNYQMDGDLTVDGGNINFGAATTIGDGGDVITIDSNAIMHILDTLNITTNLTVTSKVGIGTTAPAAYLDVPGDGQVAYFGDNEGQDYVTIRGGNNASSTIGPEYRLSRNNTVTGNTSLWTITADNRTPGLSFWFSPNSTGDFTNLMQIYETGNRTVSITNGLAVGEGIPEQAFDVTGNASIMGNIGIGTDTPTALIDATGTGGIGVFSNTNETFGGNLIDIETDRTQNAAYNFLRVRSDVNGTANTTFRLIGNGNGTADGAWTGGGADYAEYFYSFDSSLNKGTVVSIDDHDARSTNSQVVTGTVRIGSRNDRPLGVISTKAGIVGILAHDGTDGYDNYGVDPNYKLVGLIGQLPVKVISTGGDIRTNDFLAVSSSSGLGQRANTAGYIIGSALEAFPNPNSFCTPASSLENISWPDDPYGTNDARPCFQLPDGSKVGKILMNLSITWYNPTNYITDIGNLNIRASNSSNTNSEVSSNNFGAYEITNEEGNIITNIGTFSESVIANLKAGFIQSTQAFFDSLIANSATITNLTVDNLIVRNSTNSISYLTPLSTDSGKFTSLSAQSINSEDQVVERIYPKSDHNITIDLSPENSSESSHLVIEGTDNLPVTTIDDEGNIQTAGDISTENNLIVGKDATISGTLYADNILTNHGSFADLLNAATQSSQVTNIYNITQIVAPTVTPTITPIPTISTPESTPSATISLSPTPTIDPLLEGSSSALLGNSSVGSLLDRLNSFLAQSSEVLGNTTLNTNNFVLYDGHNLISADGQIPVLTSQIPETVEHLTINQQLSVVGDTSLSNTTISGTLMVDGGMVFSYNTIAANVDTLNISALDTISFMGGTIVMTNDGKLTVDNTLIAKGGVETPVIRPLTSADLTVDLNNSANREQGGASSFGQLLVKGTGGETVTAVDSGGNIRTVGDISARNATFTGNTHIGSLSVPADYSATESANIRLEGSPDLNGQIVASLNTSGQTGLGIIPAGKKEILLRNTGIGDHTLVYLTPVTSTGGQTLFVKEIVAGQYFRVALDNPLTYDIRFNWWMIEGRAQSSP